LSRLGFMAGKEIRANATGRQRCCDSDSKSWAGKFVRQRLLFTVRPLILNTKAKSTVEEPDDIIR
jgi:hypothetical protein